MVINEKDCCLFVQLFVVLMMVGLSEAYCLFINERKGGEGERGLEGKGTKRHPVGTYMHYDIAKGGGGGAGVVR